jgi:glycosyltransferase involved in cell wall biosynthesis
MELLYIADGRSPIALNWIRYFVESGEAVHLISTAPSAPPAGLKTFHVIPLAFSGLQQAGGLPLKASPLDESNGASLRAKIQSWLSYGPGGRVVTDLRYVLSAMDVQRHVSSAREIIETIKPDLIHAMRIPFEGILAALAARLGPLLISVWGNDFTLFAHRYRSIGRLTRSAMTRTDALHSDCQRDRRLATRWGFDNFKPAIVLPGAGGIRREVFQPRPVSSKLLTQLGIPEGADVVINPRGYRAYVRNDTFFRAIPLVLKQRANVVFLCSGMAGNPIAEAWVTRLGIDDAVRLLPPVEQPEMALQFAASSISLSLSEHDGTPNTLLEAMACGCFPIAGDIETVREWIVDGRNGLLCDPADPQSVCNGVLRALSSPDLRIWAREENLRLIAERADYYKCMEAARVFYSGVLAAR